MSKYIVSSLSKYSEHDNEIPMVNKVVTFNKKPTLEEANAEFEEFDFFDEDEWRKIDDETWETYIDDDYYEYDDKHFCLIGRRYRHRYSLGDAITVRVAQANLDRKQLDFEPVS